MRFVLAIVCFVIAAGLIGVGVAQRTVLAGPSSVSAHVELKEEAPVTVISGAALNAYPRTQTIELSGSNRIFVAYGRTADVLAWIGDATYTEISVDAVTGSLKAKRTLGSESTVPNPAGSDLWIEEFEREVSARIPVNVPRDVSVLVVSDGENPAPSSVGLSWPLDSKAPWSGPLIAGGAILLLIGLIMLVWALVHMRRRTGPRRKPPKMPKIPRQARYKPRKPPAVGPGKGRRSIARSLVAVPVLLATSVALAGCSADYWPSFLSAEPTPTPTATVDPAAELPPTAVTIPQVERIIGRLSAVVTEADATANGDLAKTRLTGAALELRAANYAIRGADSSVAALPPIPAGPVKLTLPQQTDTWPRTVFTVIQDAADPTVAPLALILVQETPRDAYKASYVIALEPEAVLPDVAPASLGTARLSPDIKLLQLPPSAIATAYGDILAKDTEAEHFAAFHVEGDTLRTQVGLAKKNERRAALPTTASIEFSHEPGVGEIVALASNDSGALVAVSLNEIEVVKPVEAGAAVNAVGAVKALSGKATSTKGIRAVYADQLLFYVPASTNSGKIQLLGFSQGLVAASEVP